MNGYETDAVDGVNDPAAAARRWFSRMRADNVSAAERQAFTRWLNAAAENAEAYRAIELWWRELDTVKAPILERFGDIPPVRAADRHWRVMVAAGLAAVVALPWLWPALRDAVVPESAPASVALAEQNFSAPIGSLRELALADGSRIVLAPGSALRVQFDTLRRTVALERGEALFSVAHDAARPFALSAGAAEITVLGTVFDVKVASSETRVTVHQGRVRLAVPTPGAATLELGSGRRGRVRAGALLPAESADLATSSAWRDGVVVFDGEPLRDVVAELGRYSAQRLELIDPALGDIPVSGVFRQGELADFLAALTQSLPIALQPVADGYQLVASPARR